MIEEIDARRNSIRDALDEYKRNDGKRTAEINFRGSKKYLPVVTLTPNILLLNHNNARLSAQLVDHPDRDKVFQNPTSVDSQKILEQLLRSTEKYSELKVQLENLRQQNPGLITIDGLLVNGNTRVVALRELGVPGVDVAVLPIDTNSMDLLEIEMSLQMTRLLHQDYTFTNELLLMDKYVKAGHSNQQLATMMGWIRGGQKKVEQRLRILAIVEEIRRLSATYLPYHVFDSKEEHLKDLDKEYQDLKNSGDIEAAERMMWSRIAAIFLGVNKDQVRTIDDFFFEEEAMKRIGDNLDAKKLLDHVTKVTVKDGLNEILGESDSNIERPDMKEFVKHLLNDSDTRDANGGIKRDLDSAYSGVAQAVRLATDQVIKRERWESYVVEPSTALRDVQMNIREICEKFPEVYSTKEFDLGKFRFELKQCQKALTELATLLEKLNRATV